MRGTPAIRIFYRRSSGIIPAYAGNTSRRNRSMANLGDHPRVCGEHHLVYSCAEYGQGSSPRMRGTLLTANDNDRRHGIIPAYAGNTFDRQ